MSILTEPERTSHRPGERALSWRRLAAAVRRRARNQPEDAADLQNFADLLEGFAELEEMTSGRRRGG